MRAFFFLAVSGALMLAGCGGGGSSSPPPASAPPAPTGLAALAGNGQVSLSWTASASSYNVYRGTAPGSLSIVQSGIVSTSYVDQTVKNGTTYYYQVTAVNSAGESPGSNEVSATPYSPVPAKTTCSAQGLAVNQMPVCFATVEDGSSLGSLNVPYVTVFITNSSGVPMPINLELDTGSTGVIINQSALQAEGISVPQTNETFSGLFADSSTVSGYLSSASVSTLPSGGLSTAASFPIAVNTDSSINAAYPQNDFLSGNFGMGLSASGWVSGSYSTPSIVYGLPGPYAAGFLLLFQAGMNSDGYATTGGGTITFGLDTAPNNSTLGYSFFPNEANQAEAFITLGASFGGTASYTAFDTGTPLINMDEQAMDEATSPTITDWPAHEYDFGLVIGGITMNLGLWNGTVYDSRAAFITDPNDPSINYKFPAGIFNYTNGFLLQENTVIDVGPSGGQEIMGLPYLFNYPMYFAAPSSGKGWGVGIKFN